MKTFKTRFLVGLRTCEMTYKNGELLCEWSPSRPTPAVVHDPVQMQQYRDGRDALLAVVQRETGVNLMVVET